eukprot:TRINITY_DN176_c1_g1_i1.p1 TRINITY_DN176_c1_g1~~TRINITY_DN176_c1_g1_i1.p1  ORF type:complete len:100 (+),score=5.08 TRINITY_DN176_c1_g1_i1:2731-3030(+)
MARISVSERSRNRNHMILRKSPISSSGDHILSFYVRRRRKKNTDAPISSTHFAIQKQQKLFLKKKKANPFAILDSNFRHWKIKNDCTPPFKKKKTSSTP